MKKRGFTLVELLAVIAILAILIIIALPNIMSLFNDSKKESFTTEIKTIAKTAQQQWMNDSMFETKEMVYARCESATCSNQLKLSGRQEIEYYIKLNKNGEITKYYVTDGTYQYEYNGTNLKIEDIENIQTLALSDENSNLKISCLGKVINPVSFAEDSWDTISASVQEGNTSFYHIGDTKEVTLNGYGTHTVRISNISTPSECSNEGFSQTACGFVIEFTDIITMHRMNPYNGDTNPVYTGIGNIGGWKYSEMRSFVNNEIYNSFPSDLKNVIIDTFVVSGYGYDEGPENFTNIDKVYLVSTYEVIGQAYPYTDTVLGNETRQLDYYKNTNTTYYNYNAIQKRYRNQNDYWFTRSTYPSGRYHFHVFYPYGQAYGYNGYDERGVSPLFRIG